MTRWIAILALIVGIGGIVFLWTSTNSLNQKINLLEQKMTNAETELQKEISSLSGNIQQLREQTGKLTEQTGQLSEQAGQLKQETGKLVAAKQDVEAEENVLKKNPSELIDVLDFGVVEKGFITITKRINKVQLRSKSRFNVREIQISIAYIRKNGEEAGMTATIYVHDLLVAGETKWFDAHNAEFVPGDLSARGRVIGVEVVGK